MDQNLSHPASRTLVLPLDPVILRLAESQAKNVVFIANNHLITPDAFATLTLAQEDILVQFNLAPHFDALAPVICHKLHVFNANGDGSYWGFTKDGLPERDYLAQAASCITIFFSRWLSRPAKHYLGALPENARGGLIAGEFAPAYFSYPAGKMASAGFLAVSFFKALNHLRIFAGKPAFKLTLFGFSGVYPTGASWDLHDYTFEQATYGLWHDLVKLDHQGTLIETSK